MLCQRRHALVVLKLPLPARPPHVRLCPRFIAALTWHTTARRSYSAPGRRRRRRRRSAVLRHRLLCLHPRLRQLLQANNLSRQALVRQRRVQREMARTAITSAKEPTARDSHSESAERC